MNLSTLAKLTEEEAREKLESIRWPDGAVCPHCGSKVVVKLAGKSTRPGLYKCKDRDCRKQFTVTVNTIFADSHISINMWLQAFFYMASAKKGVSALQIKRQFGIAYKTAWHMCHRIRHAMAQEPMLSLLSGTVEVDETYVGGKLKNMHRSRRREMRKRGDHKVPLVALVQREGGVRVRVVPSVGALTLAKALRENVEKESHIMTDGNTGYQMGVEGYKSHSIVDHSKGEYVRKQEAGLVAFTNTVESFFSLFKRGLNGSFHHVSKTHLQKYSEEFAFRWNHRKDSDEERTLAALRLAPMARLVYEDKRAA